jgi:hypothetical protein
MDKRKTLVEVATSPGSTINTTTCEEKITTAAWEIQAGTRGAGVSTLKPVEAHRDADLDFPCASRSFVRVPECETFQAGFVRAERGTVGGRPKVFLFFRIVAPGPHFGTELYMSCTVATAGKWPRSSKFYQSWMLAAGKEPARGDRLSTKVFRGKLFRVRTHTVRRNSLHVIVPEALQYSVIECLLEVTAGGSTAPARPRTLQKIGSLLAPKRRKTREE